MQTDDSFDPSSDPGKYQGLGTTPVPGDNPAGSRIVDWGTLGREYFSKLSSPTGGAISWPAVAEAALEMLGKAKDLRVALVATEALIRTESLAGMADGFDLLACLGQSFGGDLFPKRESDRHGKVVQLEDFALEWVQGQRSSILPAAQPEVARACAKVKAARRALAGPCADETVLARLERAMDSLQSELAPAGAAAPTESAPPAIEAAAAPAPPSPEPVATSTAEPVAPTPTAPAEKEVEQSYGAPGKYHALGSTPISLEQPAGDKITNWGQLATEYFQKLSSPLGGAINWNSVSSAALELLETGKDLRVALVATSALMKTGNFVGLADGLDLLGTLAKTFGQDLHPRNPGDRHKKIVAFEEELLVWFKEKKDLLNPQGMEMLELALIKAEFARNELGGICDEGGVLGRACRALKARKEELESEAVAAVEAAKVKAAPAAAGSAPPRSAASRTANQVPDKVENQTELNRVLAQARKLMRLASKYFNEHQAGEPITLRVERTAQWLCNVNTPPDDFLEQPSAEIVERLQGESSKGSASMDELSRLAGNYPFWMAGQRMIHAQLEAEGRKEEAAVVRAESAAIATALTGLDKVKFKDGESVMDEATVAWLAQGAEAQVLLGPDVSGVVDKKEEKLRKKVRREADKLALKECIPEAIAKYQLASQQCSSGRDRFLWKLELASFCFAHSPSIARSLLVDLEGEVAREGLGAWEPDLAIVVYTELLKLCPEDDVAKRDELFGKLVLIDPQRAARLQFPRANASVERAGSSKPPAGKKES